MKFLSFVFLFWAAAASSATDSAIDSLMRRMDGYEAAISRLTDEVERANFELRNLRAESERKVKDLQIRISDLEQELTEAAPAPAPAAAPAKPLPAPVAPVGPKPAPKPIGGALEVDLPTPAANPDEFSFASALDLYDDEDFEGAVVAFGENIRALSDKRDDEFYDNMFYLGLSFDKLGKKTEACRTFAAIASSAPKAAAQMAADKSSDIGCKLTLE